MPDSPLDSLRKAVHLSPDNVPLLTLFAHACIDAWNFEEGMAAFESILKIDPKNQSAQTGIAQILFKMGKKSEAMVRLEAQLDKNTLDPPGILLYSRVLASQGDKQRSREFYRRALSADPALKNPEFEKELDTMSTPDNPSSDRPVKVPAAGPERSDALAGRSEADEIDDLLNSIVEEFNPAGTAITFEDVGGMHAVKEEIKMKILYPLNNPELFKAYGKKIGGGILLYGPPGCGKTLISKAIAGEIKASFISIGLHQILDMWLGNSEKNLHGLFEMAREQKPAVLFIDEVDALAADRSSMKNSAGRTLINQMLSEMDGISAANDGVLIIAATNAPWHLDSAFRRPGRFDRTLFVPPPDAEARESILRILIRSKPVEEIDYTKVAAKTEHFSGADIAALIDTAAETLLSRAMKENRVIPLSTRDLLSAAAKIKPSTKAWFETGKNYALFSNQSGFYDDVLAYLGIKK
jgi:transitional endoplasmic reticulum ATPase